MKNKSVNMFPAYLLALVFALAFVQEAEARRSSVEIGQMRVEYADTPLGIDVEAPRFGWMLKAEDDVWNCRQKAFRLRVTDERGHCVWDTGRRSSDTSQGIAYGGRPLEPATRYDWTVEVWTSHGKADASSWFETGLMCTDDRDAAWGGARWIGGDDEDMVLYAHYLPVFQLACRVQLDEASGSTCASMVYGANDVRLMDRNKNIYGLQGARDSSYIKVELDVAPLAADTTARLNVYRVGYHPSDKADVPFRSLSVPLRLVNTDNRYGIHRMTVRSVMGFTRFYVDGQEVGAFNLNPMGQGGDYIAFPVLGDIGYSLRPGQKALLSRFEVRNIRTPGNIVAFYEKVADVASAEEGGMLTFTPHGAAMPMLRTCFKTDAGKKVAKARLYVTARGIYDIYMNGRRVGEDYFNPGLTQYNKMQLYQTFDVTSHVQAGDNAMGVMLGEGWWSGGSTYTADNWNFFGDRQSLLARLDITYEDGAKETVVTSPDTWTYFGQGPVAYGSFFQGEVYDATRLHRVEGWSTASYQATGWKPATEVPLKGTVSTTGNPNCPPPDNYGDYRLRGQYGPTVREVRRLTAKSMEEVRPGVYVYDMGQNMAGVPRVIFSGLEKGTRVYMRFAEVKYPDMPAYAGNEGMVMMENIRSAMAQDIYVVAGTGDETYSPRFTSHGYRYVEITGISAPLPLEAVQGVVLSSIHGFTAGYETSNPKVNRLWQNIEWSALGNFISIPTDCPQRNERLGWMGDISVFSRTGTYMALLPQFLSRYLHGVRDVQRADGRFPDIAPQGGGFGGFLWGSAGITVPWECYRQYADTVLLEEHYEAMKRYMDYICEKGIDPQTGLLVQDRVGSNLGDWLGPEDGRNDRSLLWEAYLIYDLDLMGNMAEVLGRTDDATRYRRLCGERKAFFRKTYLQKGTGKTLWSAFVPDKSGQLADTQTSYVLPLVFDIVEGDEKADVLRNLILTMERGNKADNGTLCPPYSLMTGFIGTAWISKALSDNGRTDLAYKLLQQTHYPSWLYSVDQGATTIWERLNSYTHTDGFGGNNHMNSFNHYSFGAVGAWMCGYSLGIQRDVDTPAFKRFVLCPQPDLTGRMTYARGFYDSLYGRIESSWKKEGTDMVYAFSVPANTSALLRLPAEDVSRVTESFRGMKRLRVLKAQDGEVWIVLPSGRYEFKVDGAE